MFSIGTIHRIRRISHIGLISEIIYGRDRARPSKKKRNTFHQKNGGTRSVASVFHRSAIRTTLLPADHSPVTAGRRLIVATAFDLRL